MTIRILWENKFGGYYIADVENNLIVGQSDELNKAEADAIESLYDYNQILDRDGDGDDDDDMQPIPLTAVYKLHKIEQ